MHWTGEVERIAFCFEIGSKSFEVAWYGLILTAAIVIALIVCIYRGRRVGLTLDDFIELFVICVPLAIVGARIGFIMLRPHEYYIKPDFGWSDFVHMFNITEGGLTIMTAVPFGILGGFIWSKWRKVDFVAGADIIFPVILLAQALGRWGNFMNQEIYGSLITNPNAQWFPLAVFIPYGRDGSGFYQAVFFYEMCLNLMFFAAMMIIQKRLRLKGSGALMYLMSYTFIRFNMNFFRHDEILENTINWNMVVTGIVFALATGLFIYLIIKNRKKKERIWFSKGVPRDLLFHVRIGLTPSKKN